MSAARRIAAALAPAILLGALLVGCTSNDSWERAECAPAKPASKDGLHPFELQSSGMTRKAILYVPKGYDGTEAYPLVLNWHGYGSSAEEHMTYTDMFDVADDDGFFILAPDGEGSPKRFNLGAGITGDTDDVQLASDLIDRVDHDLCLDTRRVFSVGASNGGGMSAVLACKLGSRFAAIGMVALQLKPDGCTPPPPAIIGIQGDADLVVPYQGGRVNCCGGWPIAPAGESLQQWADELHCSGHDDDRIAKHVTRRTWHGCDDRRTVVFYRVHGGGHTWPGKEGDGPLGFTTGEIDASEVMWDFFKHFTTAA